MGYKIIELKLPTDYSDEELQDSIRKILKIENFTYQIEKQSLDGRNNQFIHWATRIGVSSDELPFSDEQENLTFDIPKSKKKKGWLW
jgi:hypothetical protein